MPKGIYKRKKRYSYNIGINNPRYGKILSDTTKKKISKKMQGIKNCLGKHWKVKDTSKMKHSKPWQSWKGERSPSWKGGVSFEPYSIDWTESLRKSIRERDHYRCQICGVSQGDIAHDCHHIDYDKKNCNPDNIITLCQNCHRKTNFNRDYWINYFNQRI